MSMQAHVLPRLPGIPPPSSPLQLRRVSLICMRRAQNGNLLPHCSLPLVGNLPRQLPLHLPHPTPLFPPLAVSHVSSCCHFNVSSVLFARVTYFDFICPLARKIRQETGKLRQCGVGRRQEEVGGGQGGGIVGVLRYPVDLLLCLIHAQIVAEIWRQVY